MVEGTRNCVVLSILTVHTIDFSSQTSGNTFGVSRVAVWYACESFLNTNLAANSVEFEVSRKHYMTFHWLKSYCTYGQFGSTLWSVWWEKARPSKNKTTNLILKYLSLPFVFIKGADVLFSWAWIIFFIVKQISSRYWIKWGASYRWSPSGIRTVKMHQAYILQLRFRRADKNLVSILEQSPKILKFSEIRTRDILNPNWKVVRDEYRYWPPDGTTDLA